MRWPSVPEKDMYGEFLRYKKKVLKMLKVSVMLQKQKLVIWIFTFLAEIQISYHGSAVDPQFGSNSALIYFTFCPPGGAFNPHRILNSAFTAHGILWVLCSFGIQVGKLEA